jgi:Rrf2 family protein
LSRIINISEAASIAIYTVVAIAKSKEKLNATELAISTNVSRNHLAKVMQQLTKYGYLISDRGPKGGFVLNKLPDEICLLDLFELVEGSIEDISCMGDCAICPFKDCVFGGLASKLTNEFKNYLKNTKISDLI